MHAVNLDMGDWWKPTPTVISRRSAKTGLLKSWPGVISPQIAATLTKLKKSEVVALADAKLSARGWVPDNLKCEAHSK